jgi:DNA invertase Pin-like site-specific DNA recombinase
MSERVIKRAALYARTSTARDQNPAMQIDELRVLAKQRGWEIIGEYVDRGVSGGKDRRPELDRLNSDVGKGKVDVVACYRFDRYARSVKHLVTSLDEYRARGVDFISLYDGIDTSTPAGRFTFHVISAVAELEREIIRERVRSGLQAARRRGEKLGRPRVNVDLTRALGLKVQGLSYRQIASKMGIGLGTLHRAIKDARDDVPQSMVTAMSEDAESKEAA